MFNQLVEMLEQMSHSDITKTANFRAIVMFKSLLLAKGVDTKLAHRIAMGATFELAGEFTDAELNKLMGPLSTIADNMISEFLDEGFTMEDIMTLGSNFSVQVDK